MKVYVHFSDHPSSVVLKHQIKPCESQMNDRPLKVDTVAPPCSCYCAPAQDGSPAPEYQKFLEDFCATEELDHILHLYSTNAERKCYKLLSSSTIISSILERRGTFIKNYAAF